METEPKADATKAKTPLEEYFGGATYTYTREQAIKDGVLVDVSETAREMGFTYPVAVTRTVWDGWIVPDEEARHREGQSESGRLWDILRMLYVAIRRRGAKGSPPGELTFAVIFRNYRDHRRITETAHLWSKVGPGDNGEPVITIMEEGDD